MNIKSNLKSATKPGSPDKLRGGAKRWKQPESASSLHPSTRTVGWGFLRATAANVCPYSDKPTRLAYMSVAADYPTDTD